MVRREVSTEGRSRAWVNGSPTTAAVLGELGALLVDLHGQHETQSLLHPDAQRDILDAFAHAEAERSAVAEAHARGRALTEEELALSARRDEVRRRADYLRHVVDEIDGARLKPGEDEALQVEARRLSQAGALGEQAQRIVDALEGDEGNALGALGVADRALAALEKVDPATAELARDAGRGLRQSLRAQPGSPPTTRRRSRKIPSGWPRSSGGGTFCFDSPGSTAPRSRRCSPPGRNRRRAGSARYRRHRPARPGRPAHGRRSVRSSETCRRAHREKTGGRRPAGARGQPPAPAARPARGQARSVLAPLAEPGPHGQESVQLDVQLNVGLEAKPLARVASGGELSRLMLALKVVLVRHDAIATLVFDEVDQGIGGEVGAQVGAALAEVAERHQVLVITHLPQIAARADQHLVVSQGGAAGIATSDVQVIHGEDRVNEIARMLGDAEGDAARRHAQAMLRTERATKDRSTR